MSHKTLIFDFDGTLADTFYIAVIVFRKLARSWHITDDTEVTRLRGLPAREVLKSLGVRWWQLPVIVYHGRKTIHEQRDKVKAFAGIKQVLAELHKRGYKLYIISSNSNKNIDHFLHNNKLEGYFDGYQGGIGVFNKAKALSGFAKRNGLDATDCYYIGDEVRDIDAAIRAGMHYASVSWGYNNRAALEAAKATTIVDTPKATRALHI